MNLDAQHAAWDAFIDALDRAGQAGSAAGVEVPPIGGDSSTGKRFGELTAAEIKQLSGIAVSLGRRGDIVVTMWQDLQWKVRQRQKAERKDRKDGERRQK